ncbi:hypothetical protein V3C99_010927 [Haemonchus contortus]
MANSDHTNTEPRKLSILSDIELVRGVVIGDDESVIAMMMEKYAEFNGLPYNDQKKELITAFNGRKCIFKAVSMEHTDRGFDDPHVFLLCLSVARQTSAEETVQLIFNTLVERIRGVPYVLVGTQIDKRLSMLIENYGCGQMKYLPIPMNKAESYAKRIGASKYLECSEVTGEGLDEVFEEAFEIGHNYALEQLRGYRRKMSAAAQIPKDRKLSCITQ